MTAKAKATKVLRGRRKKASKGRVIRLSDDVLAYFENKRGDGKTKNARSWDEFFRRVFGLPKRSGEEQILVEGWLEINTGLLFLTEAEARGRAVMEAVKQGKKTVAKPIRMREVRW